MKHQSFFHELLVFNLTTVVCFVLLLPFSFFLSSEEIPSKQKLRMSFYILEQTFSLNNRTELDLKRNEALLPLAESAVETTLKLYPNDLECLLGAIRNLYVEGNFYLRTERFMVAQKKLTQAKELCERYCADLDAMNADQICEVLGKTHPTLPSLYSLVLHHLGQISTHYAESPIGIAHAEKYLEKSVQIREVIDSHPQYYANVPDNNTTVGDAVIFQRTLGYIYLQTDRLDKAEELYTDLLNVKDSYNLLISHRQLFKVYQRKGQLSLQQADKEDCYKKAMDSARLCLELIEKEIGLHVRVATIYKDIGNLYCDEQNPFQNVEEAHQILELAKFNCPNHLKITSQFIREELGRVFMKLSQKELQDAVQLHWITTETENVDALKMLDDLRTHLVNYESLGDIYREKQSFVLASAFYSNGLRLASHLSQKGEHHYQHNFFEKLAFTEHELLKNLNIDTKPIPPLRYEWMIKEYQMDLGLLRSQAKAMLGNCEPIEKIYAVIAERYHEVLRSILKDAFAILGPPPTENYAIMALGSIAHGFATPFSDLEFAILIDEDRFKSYFKILSALFHIRINALGEAPISLFGINSMNWLKEDDNPSPRGLMLDPWNTIPLFSERLTPNSEPPLFKEFELIGTPGCFAKIFDAAHSNLDPSKELVFYTFTRLLGKQSLMDQYEQELNRVLDRPPEHRTQLAAQIILIDMERYYKRLGKWLEDGNAYELKHHFYRPFTTILDGLALHENMHASSTWKLIDKLRHNNFIDDELTVLLKTLADEIGALRLKAAFSYESQKDKIYPYKANELAEADKKCFEEEHKLMTIIHSLIPLQNTIRERIVTYKNPTQNSF